MFSSISVPIQQSVLFRSLLVEKERSLKPTDSHEAAPRENLDKDGQSSLA
ncbi:MAG: hypothetical protein AB4368_24960 [Xenococcaceae cyanobacterium]